MSGSNDEHKMRCLRGALFEYLDDGMIDELMEDIKIIIKEEEEKYAEYISNYKKARKLLCGEKK